jgi:hypothetical protein
MTPSKIHVPDDVVRITSPGSRRTAFTTKKAEERIRLEREDQKEKLEIRSFRREEAGSGFHKELEMSEGAVRLGYFLLEELAVQENTFKELSGEANSSREGEANLEKMKHETVEAEEIKVIPMVIIVSASSN